MENYIYYLVIPFFEMAYTISISISEQVYQECKDRRNKGDEAFKWCNIFRRGFRAACLQDSEKMTDDKIAGVIEKLNFYVRKSRELEQKLILLGAEGKA